MTVVKSLGSIVLATPFGWAAIAVALVVVARMGA